MPDRHEQALRVLGLEPGATGQAIKDAYRDLVKVWHPDRFGSDARLRAKAQEKLKELNAAFEQLRGYRASDVGGARESARPGDRASDFSRGRAPASPVEQANSGRTGNVLALVLSVALAGIVGTGLFMARRPASRQLSPAHELIATPAAGRPTRVPARSPVRPGPEESASSAVDAAREPAAPATTGSLIVASRPMGAHVSFDGRVVGETPITVTDVTPGEHHIEVTLEGNAYQPWSAPVVVTAGHEEKLLAVMTPTERGR